MAEHHPELFEKAKQFEKVGNLNGEYYTWVDGMTLDELVAKAKDMRPSGRNTIAKSWKEQLADDEDDQACLICSL